MQIQASHLNFGFMQQLKAKQEQGQPLGSAASLLQDNPGNRLGQGLNVETETDGLNPAQIAASRPGQENGIDKQQTAAPQQELTLGATFANEIVRRIETAEGEGGETKDKSDLRHSLGQTMDWIREKFGDETAAAASAMVLQSTSDGVNEESLGDGLLNALKFIDRNFGFSAGDQAIANFNNGVNTAINDYFENGQSEIFFAAPAPQASDPSATQDLTVRTFMRAAADFAPKGASAEELNQKLLEDLKKDLDDTAELQNLSAQLEAEFNPTAASKSSTDAAMAAYTQASATVTPQFASIAV